MRVRLSLSKVMGLALTVLIVCTGGVAAQDGERVLVMPFENATGDGRILWLSEASAVLLVDDLSALGVQAITRDERHAAFERLQVPPSTALTDATIIRIGQLLGASRVVVGTLAIEGDDLVVQARSIDVDVGRVPHTTSERGPMPELYTIFERLARSMAPPSDRTSDEIEAQHPPIEAFEQYIKGLVAETPATAIQYLNAALVTHPEFARPRLALWEIHTDQGAHERALAAVRAVPADSAWASRAMFLAGLSYLSLERYEDAFRTLTSLATLSPAASVFNNLGVVQLRRGGPKSGATYYFSLAADADPNDADYCFNLGYAYWRAQDPKAAIYWLREAVRRDPADGDAHFLLSVALAAGGSRAEANRERDLARRLSATYEAVPPPGGDLVPPGLERLKARVELAAARHLDETLAAAGQREQRELAAFHLNQARRLYQDERDREALEALNRALFLAPYEPDAHLLMARIHLRAHRLPDAIDALQISLWSAVTPEGHALLADAYLRAGDRAAALAEARRALALDPESVQARYVLEQAQSDTPPQ